MQSIHTIAQRISQVAATLGRPAIVAIDGGSGAGKSTVADALQHQTGAALVTLDDFFTTTVPQPVWATWTVQRRLAEVFDWDRLREQALTPLLAGLSARWNAFDFLAGPQADGTYGLRAEPTEAQPASIVLLEGAYSASAPLADLIDIAVLIDVPTAERHRRLAARETPEFLRQWHTLWDPVEEHYFNSVRTPHTFDLLMTNEPASTPR